MKLRVEPGTAIVAFFIGAVFTDIAKEEDWVLHTKAFFNKPAPCLIASDEYVKKEGANYYYKKENPCVL